MCFHAQNSHHVIKVNVALSYEDESVKYTNVEIYKK